MCNIIIDLLIIDAVYGSCIRIHTFVYSHLLTHTHLTHSTHTPTLTDAQAVSAVVSTSVDGVSSATSAYQTESPSNAVNPLRN